ncbi:MAG: nucleoside recognition protein [Lachnospiraceae bacterium]|nr:nucleoside recognition protein [Lachnospiraceae bacterium]
MNALWAGMMLVAVAYGAFHGTIPEVTQAALDSSKEAVTLCGAMLGILSFWMGLMQIGMASGLVGRLTKSLRPVLRWLFPEIPEDHPALEHIALNCVANILGLGWASTGEGLKAMEQLKKLESERRSVPPGTASGEMCTFLVLNISSLQLIPVNVIAYRSLSGRGHPAAGVGQAILATAVSTAAGVIFCRMMRRLENRSNRFL